ncbi:SPFH domain-containing protein [bacterium]|nr:SPFH domain-containing protein [bacterium]
MFTFFIVHEKTAAVVERLGRFHRIAMPGWHWKSPLDRVAGRLSLRVQELNVHVETKTLDDVFVRLAVAVQYFVMPNKIKEAFYELSNPQMQIESYIYDEVRAQVPKMKLDDVFQNKEDIANAVKTGLEETMAQYGYDIVKALVNDIDPDANVKKAMNEINAAQRIRRAAEERGEAEKILRVKQAEAEARSAILRGQGIAGQRKAIVDGLRQSVEEFQKSVPGATPNDVMQLVVMTQYFDTLKEIGASSRSNAIMLPHSPGAVGELSQMIQQSIMMGNVASDHVAEADRSRPEPKKEPNPMEHDIAAQSVSDLGGYEPEDSAPPEGESDDLPYPRTTPPRRG